MGFAQELINEIKYKDFLDRQKQKRLVEQEVEEELSLAIQQELEGNLGLMCAQKLIDSVK